MPANIKFPEMYGLSSSPDGVGNGASSSSSSSSLLISGGVIESVAVSGNKPPPSSEIQRLSQDTIRRISAEQAISDLASIVKELVDNALDAEATTIKSK
jgi:hypothetical protein